MRKLGIVIATALALTGCSKTDYCMTKDETGTVTDVLISDHTAKFLGRAGEHDVNWSQVWVKVARDKDKAICTFATNNDRASAYREGDKISGPILSVYN